MMTEDPTPQRNPETHKKHRREAFWQITLPLIFLALVFLGFAAWTVTAANGSGVRRPADASLIFLLCPVILCSILPLALVGGMAYGVFVLNKNMPVWGFRGQAAMEKVSAGVRVGADKVTEPLIKLKSKMAAFEAIKRK